MEWGPEGRVGTTKPTELERGLKGAVLSAPAQPAPRGWSNSELGKEAGAELLAAGHSGPSTGNGEPAHGAGAGSGTWSRGVEPVGGGVTGSRGLEQGCGAGGGERSEASLQRTFWSLAEACFST